MKRPVVRQHEQALAEHFGFEGGLALEVGAADVVVVDGCAVGEEEVPHGAFAEDGQAHVVAVGDLLHACAEAVGHGEDGFVDAGLLQDVEHG